MHVWERADGDLRGTSRFSLKHENGERPFIRQGSLQISDECIHSKPVQLRYTQGFAANDRR